ncbi:MAG: DNA repair protein RadC [Planctomycetota bacterium]
MGLDAALAAAAGGRAALPPGRAAALAGAVDRLGLAVLARLDAGALAEQCGVTDRQAARLAAAFALGRAVERSAAGERPALRRPGEVARFLRPFVRGLEVETFQVLALDARYRLKARVEVSRGTLDAAPVHPREVFAPALRMAAAAVIVAHNHPSGDPEPSPADFAVTERLAGAGRLVGVPLLDHVVLGAGRWVSLREKGPWPGGNGRQDRVSG